MDPSDGALAVWDRLFEVGTAFGLRPAGVQALDISRVEASLILIEAEYTSARHAFAPELKYSPFEIGLGGLVAFEKEARFTGRRALLAERAGGGPARRLVGLELDWSAIEAMYARHGLAPQISPYVHRDRSPCTGRASRSGARRRSRGGRRSRRWSASVRWTGGSPIRERACPSNGPWRASEARSARRWCRCPSSTSSANVPRSPRAPSDPSHRLRETGPVTSRRLPVVLGLVLLAGLVGLAVGLAGSALLGAIAGLVCLAVALVAVASAQRLSAPADPGRRRLLAPGCSGPRRRWAAPRWAGSSGA